MENTYRFTIKRYEMNNDCIKYDIGNDLVIVKNIKTNELYKFDGTSKYIINEIINQKSVTQIMEDMSMIYDVDIHKIEEDMCDFINDLVKNKILVEQ